MSSNIVKIVNFVTDVNTSSEENLVKEKNYDTSCTGSFGSQSSLNEPEKIKSAISTKKSEVNGNKVGGSVGPVLIGTSGGNSAAAAAHHVPEFEEYVFSEPTFSERFMRYLWLIVYLCGLCSIGFMLSIYHIFFWDSRMPAVHKTLHKKTMVAYG